MADHAHVMDACERRRSDQLVLRQRLDRPPAVRTAAATYAAFMSVRDARAIQLKLDELIRAQKNARDVIADLEDATEEVGPPRVLADLSAAGPPLIRLGDTSTGGQLWLIGSREGGDFTFRTEGIGAPESLVVTPAGTATALGVLQQGADSSKLTNIQAVNGKDVLAKLRTLPISSWTTPGDASGARHLGPSGNSFRAAFNLGSSDASIAPGDLAAVSLVAIKQIADDLEANAPGILQSGNQVKSLQSKIGAQSKRINKLTKRNRSTAKQLKKLRRQVRGLLRSVR